MKRERSETARPRLNRGFQANRISVWTYLLIRIAYFAVDIVMFLPILLAAIISRLAPRPVDIGLGPTPSINSLNHKKCLETFGYRCETFVYHTWYFTAEFDVMLQKYFPRALGPYVSFFYCLFRYKCLYIYFAGGPLGFTTLLARCEPFLLQLAGIKTVIMPYGADVHVLSRSKNKLVVDAYSRDYPGFRHSRRRTAALVDVWTHFADHIISGCDWVDYMYFWDTLTLSHFAVDTGRLQVADALSKLDEPCDPLRLIHASNHRGLKGTDHIIRAVDELREEGLAMELTILEDVPNADVPRQILAADVVIDQLVIGWYAMFAIEGMALGKPVVCYIRPDYRDFYTDAGLLQPGELPFVDTSVQTIKETLRYLASLRRRELRNIGLRSRAYVEKHHSIEAIGMVFDRINKELGLKSSLHIPS